MTPQEFRQLYLQSQDQLGNNLQTLTNLITESNAVLNQLLQSYAGINTVVEEFLANLETQQESQD